MTLKNVYFLKKEFVVSIQCMESAYLVLVFDFVPTKRQK